MHKVPCSRITIFKMVTAKHHIRHGALGDCTGWLPPKLALVQSDSYITDVSRMQPGTLKFIVTLHQ